MVKVRTLVLSGFWLFVTPWTVAPPGSSVHGILQARILKWVAIPFCRGSSQPRDSTWVVCTVGRLLSEPPGREGQTQSSCLVLLMWTCSFGEELNFSGQQKKRLRAVTFSALPPGQHLDFLLSKCWSNILMAISEEVPNYQPVRETSVFVPCLVLTGSSELITS